MQLLSPTKTYSIIIDNYSHSSVLEDFFLRDGITYSRLPFFTKVSYTVNLTDNQYLMVVLMLSKNDYISS